MGSVYFILVLVIVVAVFYINGWLNDADIEAESKKYYHLVMEDDYKFLVALKYGNEANVNKLFSLRIRNTFLAAVAVMFIFLLTNFTFINLIIALGIGLLVFKLPYISLKNYYKANLNKINMMLPYYLKSLEILIQHYTVPVALVKSIETAPEIFKPGLTELVSKIEQGDSSIQPYMDFAIDYPVRDSMRMMRLLYRLGLGNQENKQEQLTMFSKNVSSLQNKTRELKYQNRLETMEKKTMLMLFVTGGGIILILLISMMMMMNI